MKRKIKIEKRSFIRTLCEKCLGFIPTVETVNSKFEASVRLADFVSGFVRVDPKIRATYVKYVEKLRMKEIERIWKCLGNNPHSDMVIQHLTGTHAGRVDNIV
jgi:hypothetical protein